MKYSNDGEKILILNLLDLPISDIILQLKELQENNYDRFYVAECWGGNLIPLKKNIDTFE